MSLDDIISRVNDYLKKKPEERKTIVDYQAEVARGVGVALQEAMPPELQGLYSILAAVPTFPITFALFIAEETLQAAAMACWIASRAGSQDVFDRTVKQFEAVVKTTEELAAPLAAYVPFGLIWLAYYDTAKVQLEMYKSLKVSESAGDTRQPGGIYKF